MPELVRVGVEQRGAVAGVGVVARAPLAVDVARGPLDREQQRLETGPATAQVTAAPAPAADVDNASATRGCTSEQAT